MHVVEEDEAGLLERDELAAQLERVGNARLRESRRERRGAAFIESNGEVSDHHAEAAAGVAEYSVRADVEWAGRSGVRVSLPDAFCELGRH